MVIAKFAMFFALECWILKIFEDSYPIKMEIGRMVIGKVIQSNSVWRAVSVSVQRMKLDVNTNVVIVCLRER